MTLRFIHIITLALVFFVKAYSATAVLPVPTVLDPFEHLPGAKPLVITTKDDQAAKGMAEFEVFRSSKSRSQAGITAFKIIRAFVENAIRKSDLTAAPAMTSFSAIEQMISEPAGGHMMAGGDRILAVDLELLAEIINVHATTPVTDAEIGSYIEKQKQRILATKQYHLLKHFAKKSLPTENAAIDQMDQWFLDNSMMMHGMHDPSMANLLKGDFGTVLKLVSGKFKRDISGEFQAFLEENSERQSRVDLYQDVQAYQMLASSSGSMSMPMPTVMLEQVMEPVFLNMGEMQFQALPKSYNLAAYLMSIKGGKLGGLIAEVSGPRFRASGRFIVCSQGSGKETHHPDLYKESLITIKGGLIYHGDDVLDTADTIWALAPNEECCIYPQKKSATLGAAHHSYFFQIDDVGKPLACGGHTEVRAGKIKKINRGSGHYNPATLQLILAVAYFHEKGVVADDAVLDEGFGTGVKSLAEVLDIAKSVQF
ncbi:MAG: hypothetical protein NT128_03360 [Proteobacteria bacterium]|nr:hypothetical protein [Pseudomonadota bacterium]